MSLIGNVRDSKQLTPRERDVLYEQLTHTRRLSWAVAQVSAQIIDRRGIQHAVRMALARALRKLTIPHEAELILDGGLRAPCTYTSQEIIIRGDATVPLIAAASVLAKVTRDRYMLRMHERYPLYGFDAHKGYGTRKHVEAIRTYGFLPIHRKTFCSRLIPAKQQSGRS